MSRLDIHEFIKDEKNREFWFDWNWIKTEAWFSYVWFLDDKDIDLKNVKNFVYDRNMGIIMCNFDSGMHHMFMKVMEQMYQKKLEKTALDEFHERASRGIPGIWDDFATQYLMNHRGFFLSNVSDYILKDPSFKLTKLEKSVFKGYEFRDI